MQYDLLNIFIEHKLYDESKDAHGILLIQHLGGKITDDQFIDLYEKLFPDTKGMISEIYGVATANEDEFTKTVEVPTHYMPNTVFDLVCELLHKGTDVNLDLYYRTGQLSNEQYKTITQQEEGVE